MAQGQTVSTSEGVNLALTLVANDNQRLSYRIVGKPAHGVLQGEMPNLVYQPESGFFGTDSFNFKTHLSSQTLSGVAVNHCFTEEPCAGKLASTVLNQRRAR